MLPKSSTRPRWYAIPVRVLLATFLGSLLCFAISLLLGIVGTAIVARLRGLHPDMTIAYRHIALPVAAVAGSIILVLTLALEIRHHQQSKALSNIERMS